MNMKINEKIEKKKINKETRKDYCYIITGNHET